MIYEPSVEAVSASRLDERFGKPLYDTYGFAQIPQTIYHRLTGEGEVGLPDGLFDTLPKRFDKIILLFVDAFGWRFFDQFRDEYPFLKRFVDDGIVAKLTTLFPSTTAAHTTTIHTGLPPSKSGIYEWFFYDPMFDKVIAPLLYSFAGDKGRNTLEVTGISPRKVFPKRTLYERLKRRHIASTIFQHVDYTPSPFSNVVFTGARVVPYKTPSEALVNLTDAVLAEKGKGYFFMYLDTIDAIAHRYGPGSRQFVAEVDTVMSIFEKVLHGNLVGKASSTLLLVTADHGQIEVSPKTTLYLNRLDPSITSLMRLNKAGEPILFGGSPRDLFLYIKDEALDEAQGRLTALLKDRANVYRVQTLIDQGFFGPLPASAKFMERVGNLVILPYEHESVFWYEEGRYEQRFYGHHGGLSRQEMETELLMLMY